MCVANASSPSSECGEPCGGRRGYHITSWLGPKRSLDRLAGNTEGCDTRNLNVSDRAAIICQRRISALAAMKLYFLLSVIFFLTVWEYLTETEKNVIQ